MLIGYDGDVKVTDFGVARSLMSAGLKLTQPGTVVGTPAYVAPEFLRGEKLAPTVDLYGLGGVAYRLLTGKSPFPGTARVVVMKAMGQTPVPAGELRPDAPRWLTEGVADFVGRPPAPRLPDAADVAQLPSDADLAGPAASAAYDSAWWFARFVAESYGAQTLRVLYLRACGPGHPDVAIAVRDTLGADMPTVLARWRHWMSG